ncbi:carboxypeptidase-like regulatory domain-containing protein [Candidatus Neomarinimicrobiota bacterium]
MTISGKKIIGFAIIVLLAQNLFGGTTGKLAGRITDENTGDPLIGANVIIEGTSIGAATDINGYFVILNIQPGSYDVRINMIGYTQVVGTNLSVNLDLTTTFDAALSVEVLGGKRDNGRRPKTAGNNGSNLFRVKDIV